VLLLVVSVLLVLDFALFDAFVCGKQCCIMYWNYLFLTTLQEQQGCVGFVGGETGYCSETCVVLLQGCVGFVGGETGYCSETCVTGGVGGTGEGSVKVEDAVDIKEEDSVRFEAVYIKDELPDTIISPPIKTELEVRLCSVC
jgi:hypothetical protein